MTFLTNTVSFLTCYQATSREADQEKGRCRNITNNNLTSSHITKLTSVDLGKNVTRFHNLKQHSSVYFHWKKTVIYK